jgi:NADPH:quinone reductase-like Zn-dependent oxidoreductase
VRTLYFKDLRFFGCMFQEDKVFENLVSYIERGKIRPHIRKVYSLKDIVVAQEDLVSKAKCGKSVLSIPHDDEKA